MRVLVTGKGFTGTRQERVPVLFINLTVKGGTKRWIMG